MQRLGKVEALVGRKQQEMRAKMEQLDERNGAMSALAVDLAYLRKTSEELAAENERMQRRLSHLQGVDEVHIEIDVLAQTPQGVTALKERYAKLQLRFEAERKRYDALEREYFKIEPQLQRIKKLRTQIAEVKAAADTQKFHLARYEDLAGRVEAQKETVLSQEEIIQNLALAVKA